MMISLALLGGACAPCGQGRALELEIGTGERAFEPLDPNDPVFELVYGPQGGWHVVLAFAATGLRFRENQSLFGAIGVGEFVGEIDGEVVARESDVWVNFECDRGRRAYTSRNTFLIFDVPDPAPLHRAALDVYATILDPDDRRVSGQVRATILDPTRGD